MLALALALALALGFAAAGRTAIDLMTGLAEVRATAATYLPYVVALPLVAVFAFLFDGVFIGATRTAEMRNGMALALGVFLGAVALLAPPLGNHGLWLGDAPVHGCARRLARRVLSVHCPRARLRCRPNPRQADVARATLGNHLP